MNKKIACSAFLLCFLCLFVFAAYSPAACADVRFEGTVLPGGMVNKNGTDFVLLSEIADAEGISISYDAPADSYSFPWRLDSVTVSVTDSSITYEGTTTPFSCCRSENGELLVPVREFCDAIDIGCYYDEEFDDLYCTAAAGDWTLPEGYDVAVMMYHGTGHTDDSSNLIVSPASLEDQLKFMKENGYTTVWFEDLWNVENISKPVILVFDDGWANNYRNLLPLLEKHDCKATIAIVEDFTDESSHIHLSSEEVKELVASGHVSIQSHTATHCLLGQLSRDAQEYEMDESKRFITRLTGKEPFVLVYPTGDSNSDTLDLLPNYYRFGVKMVGNHYNTSDDPRLVYRFFPESFTTLNVYQAWLESAFPKESNE